MDLPSTRIREVLGVLRDMNPSDARVLLGQVVATLDAAELESLRKQLPVHVTALLPAPSVKHSGAEVIRASVLLERSREPLGVSSGPVQPELSRGPYIDAATVMNTAPMPWELNPVVPPPAFRTPPTSGVETGKIIRQAVPPRNRLGLVIAALGSVVLGLVLALVFLPFEEPELERPRPVVAPRTRPAPSPATPARATETAKPAPAPVAKPKKVTARKAAPAKAPSASKPADWASPFERRN